MTDPTNQVAVSEQVIPLAHVVQVRIVVFQAGPHVHNHISLGRLPLFVVQILVEHGSDHQRNRSESQVVKGNVPIVENALSGVAIEKAENDLRKSENHILVEEIQNHLSDSDVTPTAVDHQQFPKSLEFGDGVITGLNCSHSFLAVNSNSDMSLLDHVDIIGAISDGESDLFEVVLDQSDHVRFFFGGDSATDHALAFCHYVVDYVMLEGVLQEESC